MCTWPCNPCHTLKKAITNTVKLSTWTLKKCQKLVCSQNVNVYLFSHGPHKYPLIKNLHKSMDIICLHEMSDTYFRSSYSMSCLLALVSGVCSYVLVSKRSLNAHFERKLFLFSGLFTRVQESKF